MHTILYQPVTSYPLYHNERFLVIKVPYDVKLNLAWLANVSFWSVHLMLAYEVAVLHTFNACHLREKSIMIIKISFCA